MLLTPVKLPRVYVVPGEQIFGNSIAATPYFALADLNNPFELFRLNLYLFISSVRLCCEEQVPVRRCPTC